jgi:hypothetical protein
LENRIAFLIALLVVFAAAACLLYADNSALSSQLHASRAADDNLSAQVQSLQSTVSGLTGQVNSLSNQNTQLTGENEAAQQAIEQRNEQIANLNGTIGNQSSLIQALSGNINQTKDELDAFEKNLNDTSSWFKTNDNITNFQQYDDYRFHFEFACVRFSGNTCQVRLACLPLVNDQYMGFSYKTDEETTGNANKMQTLPEIYDHRGGDCKDYSLVTKAELNLIRSYCAKAGKTDMEFEAAQAGGTGDYIIDFPMNWEYPNAEAYEFPKGYANYFMLCGAYPPADIPNADNYTNVSGHCMLAFSKAAIGNSTDVYAAISDAILFEPQTGFYYGETANDSTFIKPQDGQDYTQEQLYTRPSFWTVVTDNDYYLYSKSADGTWRWSGYQDLYAKAEQARTNLTSIQNN